MAYRYFRFEKNLARDVRKVTRGIISLWLPNVHSDAVFCDPSVSAFVPVIEVGTRRTFVHMFSCCQDPSIQRLRLRGARVFETKSFKSFKSYKSFATRFLCSGEEFGWGGLLAPIRASQVLGFLFKKFWNIMLSFRRLIFLEDIVRWGVWLRRLEACFDYASTCQIQTVKSWHIDLLGLRKVQLEVSEK